ncbi:MAG: hypothetical protein ABSE56_05880 [Bryobacteraceae bacterium]|jgi:hypothetical protein
MTPQDSRSDEQSQIHRWRGPLAWFAKWPWLGLVASICSIISVPLGVYFYSGSQRTRQLAFAVNPVQTIVVSAGRTSAIRVLSENMEIKSDVIAEQLVIWNSGTESIRPEHVLDPITISTRPRAPILEVTIPRRTRDLTGFTVDDSERSSGRVGLKWKILEKNDGAMVQVIHAGPPTTELLVGGAVEGQRAIDRVVLTRSRETPRVVSRRSEIVVMVLFGVTFAVALLDIVLTFRTRPEKPLRLRTHLYIVLVLFGIAGVLLGLSMAGVWGPSMPFRF